MIRWAEAATIETLIEFVQDRDKQMDEQDRYFEAAEELADRVSALLDRVRRENGRPPHYGHGRLIYTDEILEVLADRGC